MTTKMVDYRISARKNLAMEDMQDVKLPIHLVLGKCKLKIRELLELKKGSVVRLDRLAGENVDFVVNGKVIAKGEVMVVDDAFAVRLILFLSPEERLKLL